jgi:hypothetical protein
MRLRLFIGLAFALMIVAACQGPPPTQIILVVTATPLPGADTNVASSVGATPTEAVPTNEQPTARAGHRTRTPEPPTLQPTNTPASQVTATPAGFPTPTTSQIQVAEQVFEHGRMFWVEPTKQIWVLIVTSEGHGSWTIYPDTYQDGEPEIDPSIVAPDGMMQPKRGFGKLWRSTPEVRNGLGWATTPEFGYVSNYEYHPGGTMDNGVYTPGPGYHILYSLYGEQFRFNEADSTWQLGSD